MSKSPPAINITIMKWMLLATSALIFLHLSCNTEATKTDNIPVVDSVKPVDNKPEDITEGGKYPGPTSFHKMLARSNGTWTGVGQLWFAPDAPPVSSGSSTLVNSMVMGGLYQISEIKGDPGDKGVSWTGLRVTGYDSARKVFTRTMAGDGMSSGGVGMEGTWDEQTKSITMPFKKFDPASGKERDLKEVYRFIDENNEILEIYGTDSKTKKEFKILSVKWTRKS